MFESMNIYLTGPICGCNEQNLSWCPYSYTEQDTGQTVYGLSLHCNTCNTVLRVGNKDFTARIILNTPYPGGGKEKDVMKVKDNIIYLGGRK